MNDPQELIHTRIWDEIPEPDNPFAAAVCRCAGYDVYGDLLGKARWIDYLYLLFKLERPTPPQATLLEGLAVALANPGPRDPAVHAAMSAGVGGSTRASALMAALAVGAGQRGGAREVAEAMAAWDRCGTQLEAWRQWFAEPPRDERADLWLSSAHPPGFDPYGRHCPRPVQQTLAVLAGCSPGPHLPWLQQVRPQLESLAGHPLAMTGVAAAALRDLAFTPEQGEMLFLLLRLPGAAAHALEQEQQGWRRFPFFNGVVQLENAPSCESPDTARLPHDHGT
ncbi:citryl-CoA lyase [Candidatus Methylocalor cossyra]|uniref:Citrate synthase (Si) n=1 Tax=Candidatus Methylocalor cossyra TaxID=3108543 RepID=A0ABM9NLE0_9GAMM